MRLDQVIVIFRYLSDKDVFERFYKDHLQSRLLKGRSVSDEAERRMIALLKVCCSSRNWCCEPPEFAAFCVLLSSFAP